MNANVCQYDNNLIDQLYLFIMIILPSQCHVCSNSCNKLGSSVILFCKCIIFICQGCANKQIENTYGGYNSHVTCSVCSSITQVSKLIYDPTKAIGNIRRLISEACQRVGVPSPSFTRLTVNSLKPLVTKMVSIDKQYAYLQKLTDLERLTVELAKLEKDKQLTTTSPNSTLSIRFLSNTFAERLLVQYGPMISRSEVDSIRCCVCYDDIARGMTVLLTCACSSNHICRECGYNTIANQLDTYNAGCIFCPLCNDPSYVLENTAEAAQYEQKLILSGFKHYKVVGAGSKCNDFKALADLYLAYAADNIYGTYNYASFEDERASTAKKCTVAIIRLEIARLEVMRLNSVTNVLFSGHKYLGPLSLVTLRQNKFLDLFCVTSGADSRPLTWLDEPPLSVHIYEDVTECPSPECNYFSETQSSVAHGLQEKYTENTLKQDSQLSTTDCVRQDEEVVDGNGIKEECNSMDVEVNNECFTNACMISPTVEASKVIHTPTESSALPHTSITATTEQAVPKRPILLTRDRMSKSVSPVPYVRIVRPVRPPRPVSQTTTATVRTNRPPASVVVVQQPTVTTSTTATAAIALRSYKRGICDTIVESPPRQLPTIVSCLRSLSAVNDSEQQVRATKKQKRVHINENCNSVRLFDRHIVQQHCDATHVKSEPTVSGAVGDSQKVKEVLPLSNYSLTWHNTLNQVASEAHHIADKQLPMHDYHGMHRGWDSRWDDRENNPPFQQHEVIDRNHTYIHDNDRIVTRSSAGCEDEPQHFWQSHKLRHEDEPLFVNTVVDGSDADTNEAVVCPYIDRCGDRNTEPGECLSPVIATSMPPSPPLPPFMHTNTQQNCNTVPLQVPTAPKITVKGLFAEVYTDDPQCDFGEHYLKLPVPLRGNKSSISCKEYTFTFHLYFNQLNDIIIKYPHYSELVHTIETGEQYLEFIIRQPSGGATLKTLAHVIEGQTGFKGKMYQFRDQSGDSHKCFPKKTTYQQCNLPAKCIIEIRPEGTKRAQ